MTTVSGIDVSYWNAGIDWPKVSASGQLYVFAKATEGDSYADPTFDDNWRGAKKAGLFRGAYHFFRSNLDAKKQATKFIDYVKSMNDNGELPPVLDLETHDGQTKEEVIARAKTWLDLVEAAFNKKPIIYSGQYFLQDHFSGPGGGPPAWAKDYPLWLAQYPKVYVDGAQPTLPRGWFKWTFWQYSDQGSVNGINGKVNLNAFNGDPEDLYQFSNAEFVTLKPTPNPEAGQIFISYRRSDSADIAGRIYDRLIGRFGRNPIFKDVDSIPLGLDFKEILDAKVSECAVLLAIIGDHWLEAADDAGERRLIDPVDFVRIEIESALKRGIPVIPLLVRGARMPREAELPDGLKKLAYRNGIPIRPDPDFHNDMDRLITALENLIP